MRILLSQYETFRSLYDKKKLTNRYKTNGTDVRFINSNLYLNVSDIGIYLYYKIYHISINKKNNITVIFLTIIVM